MNGWAFKGFRHLGHTRKIHSADSTKNRSYETARTWQGLKTQARVCIKEIETIRVKLCMHQLPCPEFHIKWTQTRIVPVPSPKMNGLGPMDKIGFERFNLRRQLNPICGS